MVFPSTVIDTGFTLRKNEKELKKQSHQARIEWIEKYKTSLEDELKAVNVRLETLKQ